MATKEKITTKTKVVVTGGKGFIGSKLVDYLVSLGMSVFVIDIDKNKKENKHAFYYNKDITDYLVDDLSIFKDADAVFHLAAEIYVQKSLEFPDLFTDVNETGTKNILDHCVQNNIKNVVFSSTASVYGNSPVTRSKEIDPVFCSNAYSLSKWNAEQMCLNYVSYYELNITALRYSNVYGYGQDSSHQYAPAPIKFLNQKSNGLPLTVVGDGLQKRDFINVQDVVEANYAAYLNNHGFNVYNVGFGNSLSILDLAKSISSDIAFLPPRDGEWKETNVDITKIKDYLGWYPKVNIQDWITNG